MKRTAWTLLILTLGSLTSCRPWASLAEHKLTINAPARVDRKGDFTFTVNVTDRYGDPETVPYQYAVLWVGVQGSVYNGSSGVPEKIQVKGARGRAMLKIIGWGSHDKWGEIANHTFDVE